METFTEEKCTPANREQLEQIYGDLYAEMVSGMASGRVKTESQMRDIIAKGMRNKVTPFHPSPLSLSLLFPQFPHLPMSHALLSSSFLSSPYLIWRRFLFLPPTCLLLNLPFLFLSGPYTASQSLELGLVDGLYYSLELYAEGM